MARLFFRTGALLAALAVALGAYSAHGSTFSETQAIWLEKATRYQMYHALALIMTALALAAGRAGNLAVAAGWCFISGIALFSGSLYAMTFSSARMGIITPFGGMLLLTGWLFLCLAGISKR